MKSLHKWAMGIVIASAAALPALAQDDSSSDLITLNDARPSVSASIALPANTTGVVRLDLSMASVVVTDAQDNVVFREADPRVRSLELSIAPNTGMPPGSSASRNICSWRALPTRLRMTPAISRSRARWKNSRSLGFVGLGQPPSM